MTLKRPLHYLLFFSKSLYGFYQAWQATPFGQCHPLFPQLPPTLSEDSLGGREGGDGARPTFLGRRAQVSFIPQDFRYTCLASRKKLGSEYPGRPQELGQNPLFFRPPMSRCNILGFGSRVLHLRGVWPFAPDSVQFRCERLHRSLSMERLLLFSHLRKENLEAFISGVAFLLQSDYARHVSR